MKLHNMIVFVLILAAGVYIGRKWPSAVPMIG